MLDPTIHEAWLKAARMGHPPSPRQVAELQYGLVTPWFALEAFLPIPAKINPAAPGKALICREATRGAGKTTWTCFLRLYVAEYVIPFLSRPGIPVRPENRNLLVFGRDERHLRDEVLGPLRNLIITCSPWLRTSDWQGIVEDTDNPSEEGLRELGNMRSKGGQKWESLRLDLANGVSIRGRTVRQSARGFHVFWVDMDDILTESNAHESAQIMDLIRGSILPAIESGGVLLLSGTPQFPSDLYDMVANQPNWDYAQFPAFDLDGSRNYEAKNREFLGPAASLLPPEYLRCLWPARLNPLHLEEARGTSREDENKYLREYLLQRITDNTALVHREDAIASRDESLSYHPRAQPQILYHAGVDPSGLRKDDAGFCVGFVDKTGTRIPAHFGKLIANPHLKSGEGEVAVIDEVNALSTRFRCFDWTVEGNGYQSVILGLMRRLNPSVRMESFTLGPNKNTEAGWLGIRTLFRNRLVRLPYRTPADQTTTDEFLHQLAGLQYIDGKIVEDPKRRNDLVSAFFLFAKSTEEAIAAYSFSAVPLPAAPGPTYALAVAQAPAPSTDAEFARGRSNPSDRSVAGAAARIAKWKRPR